MFHFTMFQRVAGGLPTAPATRAAGKKGRLGRSLFLWPGGRVLPNWWLAVTNIKLGSPLILQETEETPILLVQKTPEIFSHGRNGVKMPPLPEVLERYEYQRKEAEILRRQSQVGTDPSGFPFCCTQSPWVSTGFQSSCLTESHNFHIKHFHPKKSSNLDFCYHVF